MSATLIESLQSVADFRALRGRRYPLWIILLLAVLGTVSGCYGYCALEEFCVRHYAVLCEQLGVKVKRWPSDTTFRRIFQQLDFDQLAEKFNQWAVGEFEPQAGEWLAIDAKSIKGTVQGYSQSYQNFVSVVSVYSHQRGVVVALKQFENKRDSEIKVVQTLLRTMGLENVVFTLDALHAQKKPYS